MPRTTSKRQLRNYRKELMEYLRETTLHGFRYLVEGKTLLERVTWMVVIISCFVYAGYLIHSNMVEWENNPIVSTIESISTPVESIQFPTITVCPGDMAEADRWGFLEEMLNNLKFECYEKKEINCLETELIRSKFKSLMGQTFSKIYSFLKQMFAQAPIEDIKIEMNEREIFNNWNGMFRLRMDIPKLEDDISNWGTALALKDELQSKLLREKLEEMIVDKMGMANYFSLEDKNPFLNYGILVDLHKEIIRLGLNTSVPEKLDCQNNSFCLDKQKEWYLFLLACYEVFHFKEFGGFGTYMAHFSHLTGPSFSNDLSWPSFYEHNFGPIEEQLNQFYAELWTIFREVRNANDQNIAIYDIPALVGVMKEGNDHTMFWPWINQSKYTTSQSLVCTLSELIKYGKAWMSYLYGESKARPCNGDNQTLSWCDHYNKIFGNKLRETMTAMRLSFPQGNGRKNQTNFAFLMKDYNFLNKFPRLDFDQTNQHYIMQLIPKCQYADGSPQSPCELFKPMLTSSGICHTFNGKTPSELYESSPYLNIFKQVYNVQEGHNMVVNASGDGDHFGLTFYLDANTRARPNIKSEHDNTDEKNERKSSFTIGVNSENTPFNTKRTVLKVETGKHTVIKVIPTQIIAKEELRTLPLEKRKCRFLDEPIKGSIFKSYTQAGCQFECIIKYSQNKCGCTPWDYPQQGNVNTICDMMGSLCFFERMKDLREMVQCGCVSDCSTISYTFSYSTSLINPVTACKKGFLKKYFEGKNLNSWFPLLYKDLENQHDDVLGGISGRSFRTESQRVEKLCQDALDYDIALVTVEMGSSTLMTSITSLKTSFAEQLAIFGGTLGLFTGMSFLSAFEVIFWIKRFLGKIFQQN